MPLCVSINPKNNRERPLDRDQQPFELKGFDARLKRLRKERACDRLDVKVVSSVDQKTLFESSFSRCVKFVERTEKTMASIRHCV